MTSTHDNGAYDKWLLLLAVNLIAAAVGAIRGYPWWFGAVAWVIAVDVDIALAVFIWRRWGRDFVAAGRDGHAR